MAEKKPGPRSLEKEQALLAGARPEGGPPQKSLDEYMAKTREFYNGALDEATMRGTVPDRQFGPDMQRSIASGPMPREGVGQDSPEYKEAYEAAKAANANKLAEQYADISRRKAEELASAPIQMPENRDHGRGRKAGRAF